MALGLSELKNSESSEGTLIMEAALGLLGTIL